MCACEDERERQREASEPERERESAIARAREETPKPNALKKPGQNKTTQDYTSELRTFARPRGSLPRRCEAWSQVDVLVQPTWAEDSQYRALGFRV